ncbi:MAG: septation protein SpoVG family protein [Clostridia bacterium]|nr:septation protein SpoVG family protein [Clostridia bacterium]
MQITEVRLRRSLRDGKTLASASVVFDGSFVVHDIRIVLGSQGPFLSMPARRTQSGEYLDVAHPLTAEYREELQRRVLAAYEEWRRRSGDAPGPGAEARAPGAQAATDEAACAPEGPDAADGSLAARAGGQG